MPHHVRKRFLFVLAGLLIGLPVYAADPAPEPRDYTRLLEYIQDRDLEAPLVLLDNAEGEFDQRLNRENLAYLNQNKSLLEQVQTRLAAETLRWRLAGSTRRLLVVPEMRSEYAELFESYCRQAIEVALNLTRLPNPLLQIETLKDPVALAGGPATHGVTAYLVHNIADEYIEEYLFFNQADARTQIRIKLSNRVFTGRVGSYTSKLTMGEDHQVEFFRDPYTLWQNSARNPINVLVAPVEETLHIALRTATESAIRKNLQQVKPETMREVEAVVEEWMATEEAVVGGLVSRLMPEIFARLLTAEMKNAIAVSLTERDAHHQYRYLQQGIRLVNDLGVLPAVNLYIAEPVKFKQLMASVEETSAALSMKDTGEGFPAF